MKKLTFVAHDVGGIGGMERHLEEMIRRAVCDYEVTVVACSFKISDLDGVRFIHIPIPVKPIPLKMLCFFIVASIRLLFLNTDILHTTGAIVFNRCDVSTVHFCHAGYLSTVGNQRAHQSSSWLRKINTRLSTLIALWSERYAYRRTHIPLLVAVSSRVKREILTHYLSYRSEDIDVIPNGINHTLFHPSDAKVKTQYREQLGLPKDGPLLLFVGGDWPLKGLSHLVKSFNHIAKEFDQVSLVVVGNGDKSPYLRLLDDDAGSRVHFAGPQRDVQRWYLACDIFVFPSAYETFSLVVHEAMASGCLVLATRVGGVEDIIEDGVTGYLIDPEAQSITDRLRTALTLREEYQGIALRGLERVKSLTWEETYLRHQMLYAGIIHASENGGRT